MIRFAPFPIRHAPADDQPLNPAGRPTAIGVIYRRLLQVRRGAPARGGRVSTSFSLAALEGSVTFAEAQVPDAISLHPFAPQALPCFNATMSVLTPPRPWLLPGEGVWGGLRGLLALCSLPSGPSVANHPSSSVVSGLVLTRRLTEGHPYHRGLILIRDQSVIWASPLASRLATTTGRIAFVIILRTGRSPPVAPHLASWRRSYVQLRSSDPASTRTCTSLTRNTCKRTSTDLPVRAPLGRTGRSGLPALQPPFQETLK